VVKAGELLLGETARAAVLRQAGVRGRGTSRFESAFDVMKQTRADTHHTRAAHTPQTSHRPAPPPRREGNSFYLTPRTATRRPLR